MATRAVPAGSRKASKRKNRLPITAEQFGRFQILEDIGRGGMSRVFRAYDPQSRREVAVKTLPYEYRNDLGFRLRFEREGQLVTGLQHESIVPVYEYGEQDGQPYIVMQYMPNGSLAQRLLLGPLTPEEALGVLEPIARALDYAHSQNIIHRDIKPSNVLFDQDGRAYLADFGIASQAQSAWEADPAISGTPAYMSPEQVLREALDERSDIYSLGVIAYEMLGGNTPFGHDTPMAVALMQVYDSPPPLQSARGVDLYAIEPVVRGALAKDPQERYPTAMAFVEAFRQVLQPGGDRPSVLPQQETRPASPESPSPPLAEAVPAAPPQRIAHIPAFPEVIPSRIRQPKPAAWHGWGGRYIVAMSLVSWVGMFLASIVAALLWGRAQATTSDILVVYDASGMAVVNLSGGPLDLSDLTFQRVSPTGQATTSFSAIEWEKAGLQPVSRLGAGACYQLLNPAAELAPLTPGEAPAKPDKCKVSQGWLLAGQPDWLFWVPEGNNQAFQVRYQGRVIHTCQISQDSQASQGARESCQFTLAGP